MSSPLPLLTALALCLASPDEKYVGPPAEGFLQLRTPQGQAVRVSSSHDVWADRVVSFTPGKPKPLRDTDPHAALGKPNFQRKKTGSRNSVSLGRGGVLVVEFVDNVLVDGPVDDLVIFEVGPKIEGTRIDISTDGREWIALTTVRGARSTVDIGPSVKPGQRFRFVRLSDIQKPGGKRKSKVEGADIDAVGALHSLPVAIPPCPNPDARLHARSVSGRCSVGECGLLLLLA
jgi:hypothetical protein